MFSKKLHVDVKKSTLKIQDVKKDSATRFKHLKIVLENFDTDEAKGFFEGNFSHVYFILHDCFVTAEANLRQRVHKAHREELEQVLLLLEKILILLPELLNRRWQCHSLARILHKLLHPGNSWKLRRQALRFFILWYQALGDNAPDHIHQMFACLVPNFSSHLLFRHPEHRKNKIHSGITEEHEKREFFEIQHPSAVFHCNTTQQGPVTQPNGTPILPVQSGEKPLDNETVRFFEALLEFMVTQVVKIEWRDKHTRQHKCFQFLLERFKATYLRQVCPGFNDNFSLYKPSLELPTMRQPSSQNENNYTLCKVALIKWLANFTHISKKDRPFSNQSNSVTSNEDNSEIDGRRVSVSQSTDSNSWSSEIPLSQQDNHTHDSQVAVMLVREVLYGSRENVNFVHEIYRQAFLLDFTHAGAIRKAIAVYKDWIQMNEIPPFMLEPLDNLKDRENEDSKVNSLLENENDKSPSDSYRLTRLRNDSYLGAIHRENLFVRAGLQNVLQLFITQASNVFFLENVGGNASAALLEEQIDSCKRVLNVYRYVVMHARLEPATWDQLLRVLLQITSLVLGEKSRRKSHDSIGGKLAPAIFQTLIVTWIKANLNVVIHSQLWDQFLEVLTSLTKWKELIREWAKTLDTLTRVLARHVYNLDLNDLPLERISEQKSKKRRGVGCRASASSVQSPRRGSIDRETDASYKENIPDNLSREFRKCRPLPRSSSDNNICSFKNRGKSSKSHIDGVQFEISGPTRPHVVLPLSVEKDVIKLMSSNTTMNDHEKMIGSTRKTLIGRRTKSLDSVVVTDCEPITRCPSPTPSSGVDSNKDSPIQIENIDGNSIDTNDVSEKRSVMAGGGVRGWLPDVAVVLWRRMLSALGDVNNIQDPVLHGQVMDYFIQLTYTLIKIRLNQGVSSDYQATLPAPELIPPLTVISPWCFKAIQLPPPYEVGKLAAYRLICVLTTQPLDINLPKAHLTLFYRALHFGIMSNDIKVIHVIIKYTGPRLFSLNLPGSSLLIMDYIHAANMILENQDIEAPRTEAVSILGSLLSLPIVLEKLPVLKENGSDIETSTCPEANQLILEILLRICRREPTGIARCIALSSIAMFAYRELCLQSQHPRVPEAISVLLQSLKATHPSVVQTACDSLGLLCNKSDVLLQFYPKVPCKIIQVLSETLDTLSARERRSSLITSMLFCLSEWAMHLGIVILTTTFQGKSLLLTLFTVLDNIIHNKSDKTIQDQHKHNRHKHDEKDDFNPNIIVDNFGEESNVNKYFRPTNIQTIQLAARTVVMHLVNHLGHFPMGIGAARLSSTIVELDDVPGIDSDELSSAVFHAPNIQLLMLSNSIIMSFVELTALNSSDVALDFVTAPSIVRVLLRDLAGKAAWDSSILYNELCVSKDTDFSEPMKNIGWLSLHCEENRDNSVDVLYPFQSIPPHVIRHREPNILPTFANAASDMDNLDDLLCYIGHTSPEVLTNPEIALNSPANPPPIHCMENETMATILNQRNTAREYVPNCSQHISTPDVIVNPTTPIASAPFHHSRLFFSHLGLSGWEQRQKLHLLAKNEKLLRELRNLDGQRSRETHKMAVIYVGPGQEDKNSILGNVIGSKEYENFVARLAWEVELETHTGFLGGLTPGKASGATAPYFATSFSEILFHVATRMPLDSPESLLQKTRHLGNDEIHIVWSEHWRDYRRDIIPTEFCDVLIAIYPLPNKLYRIQISRKSEIPFFGPLFDECIVEDQVLPGLVRITALAASRAKRSTLSLYQHYYEERARSIDVVMRNYKESTTFEEFATNIYSPVPPKNSFSGVSSVTDSITTSVQSIASSNLAAALLDSHQGCSNVLRGNTAFSGIDIRMNRASDGSKVLQDSPALHGISPRPLKKMSFKSSPKPRNSNQHLTPPDSPNLSKFKISN